MPKVAEIINHKVDIKQVAERLKNHKLAVERALAAAAKIEDKNNSETDLETAVSSISESVQYLQDVILRYEEILDSKLPMYKFQVDLNTKSINDYEFAKNYYNRLFFLQVPLSDTGKVELAAYIAKRMRSLISMASLTLLDDIVNKGIYVIYDEAYDNLDREPYSID
jgi:hypothetical protein